MKRVYAIRIEDYSSKSLRNIFEKHISEMAKVKTGEWKGYRPLQNDYDIEQNLNDHGQFQTITSCYTSNNKSWLRTTFSWVHKGHVEKYLNEYSFRII